MEYLGDSKAHMPVMCQEAIDSLNVSSNMLYIDATFGRGSYGKAILEVDNSCFVLGLDRDIEAINVGKVFEKEYPTRFRIKHTKFSDIDSSIPKEFSYLPIGGVVLDLGVSSPQLDKGERGFSFQAEGDLDMQMGLNEFSAFDLVNIAKEEKLADIIYIYSDEHQARRIAKAIVKRRQVSPIKTTFELANIVHKAKGITKIKGINSATKTFQALRIAVNNEMYELEQCLKKSLKLLVEGGCLVVVSFHSGEDRIVKKFLKANSKELRETRLIKVTKEEVKANPRARSAKLRLAVKGH